MSNEQRELKRRAEQMAHATLGTHVRTTERRARNNVHFSNRRGSVRADRGEVKHLMPRATVGEPTRYVRHGRGGSFALRDTKHTTIRRWIIILIVVVLAVALALLVGRFVFEHTIDSEITIKDNNLKQSLVAPAKMTDAQYVLFEGIYDNEAKFITLAYIHPDSKVATLINIPAQTQVSLSDGQTQPISYAYALGGDAEVIKQVNLLMDVQIAHVVRADAQYFPEVVDALGGVEVNLTEEIDDPDTGTRYIPAGQETLDGADTLVAARANNYRTPITTRSNIQTRIFTTLIDKLTSASDIPGTLDAIAQGISTDMTFEEIEKMVKTIGDLSSYTTYEVMLPGSSSRSGDTYTYLTSQSELTRLTEAVKSESDPNAKPELATKNPADISVSIRNGAGITGGASALKDTLTDLGYNVVATGNAENYVYDETLVIYKSEDMEGSARALVSALGVGRTTDASAYYSFDSDILVIIGKDFTL